MIEARTLGSSQHGGGSSSNLQDVAAKSTVQPFHLWTNLAAFRHGVQHATELLSNQDSSSNEDHLRDLWSKGFPRKNVP